MGRNRWGRRVPVTTAAAGANEPQGVPAQAPDPTLTLQINALQATTRMVFAFRLAMLALSAPVALLNAAPGLGTRLVGAATVATFMVSYVLFRDWERFGPLLLRHPTLLALDTLFGALLLISAGPDTPLAYVSVCTPLLAGIAYGYRAAAVFASLQSLILLLAHTITAGPETTLAEKLLLPGFCVITGAAGSALRKLMLRFGEATQALATTRARLAATEAVSAERARLAREMHDSVAKTLHGVALAAEALSATAVRTPGNAPLIKAQAELVARSTRRAAAESRQLLTGLRSEEAAVCGDVFAELRARAEAFTTTTGLQATYTPTSPPEALPPLSPSVTHHLLTIVTEAMDNAHRHASPTAVNVRAGVHDGVLRISVYDDGTGLPAGTSLEQLRSAGHFGLLGMAERAASVGARIRMGRGDHEKGTEVLLELPLSEGSTDGAKDMTA
ncbi:sensor histidine kinase [Streptomyces sp. G1]|uniref:sensor histidine kinase n=1 Tax=Streptomyces sp. G1 TaxID=361572 RepID=UPI0035AB6ED3